MKKPRFSKASLIDLLTAKRQKLKKTHHFSSEMGWSQVEGREISVIVDYGHFEALDDLINELEDKTPWRDV